MGEDLHFHLIRCPVPYHLVQHADVQCRIVHSCCDLWIQDFHFFKFHLKFCKKVEKKLSYHSIYYSLFTCRRLLGRLGYCYFSSIQLRNLSLTDIWIIVRHGLQIWSIWPHMNLSHNPSLFFIYISSVFFTAYTSAILHTFILIDGRLIYPSDKIILSCIFT